MADKAAAAVGSMSISDKGKAPAKGKASISLAGNKEGEGPKSFERRDKLAAFEEEARALWEKEKVFEVDAPAPGTKEFEDKEKYFVTFPYPYMNGYLHLGHAFSLTKTEFAVGYQRMLGKKCLWPFGFHCTGMPIQAAANKLKREYEEPEAVVKEEPEEEAVFDPSKHGGKKGKLASKSSGFTKQSDILKSSGVPEDIIPKFVDPHFWLDYFPPIAMDHLKKMGCRIDWRRTFITTDVNPYYDSFIRWQFETLKKMDLVRFGKRYTVYSPLDGQPCADHDRASGEGVGPQEYVLVKLQIKPDGLTGKLESLKGKKVYLAPATLRPETMYGQTNCFVLPDGDYGFFEFANGDILVMCERAAKNMSYQGHCKEEGKPVCLLTCKGWDLLGLPLSAPFCTTYDTVYVLPMLTISLNKGTGVVTSVPSDSPDDYAAIMDLKKKPEMRKKFNITDEMVVPFEVIPIIDIPGFGDKAAVKIYEDLKIQSQNDKVKLAEAKEILYTKGFYEGVMTVGDFKGKKVSDAKPLIRQQLLDASLAVVYCEPAKTVTSRSGDECVVAFCDQWYINYGEEKWLEKARACLSKMETYHDVVRHSFEGALGWLHEWACSRSFGLGTKLPWDPKYVVESLSDSTIYMAFYTVAHLLQGGVLNGQTTGPAGIKPEQLTNEVWDYIFRGEAYPANCGIPEDTLKKCRQEFDFWYPVDLRVSGKDLVPNHLTFWIYNHTALFPEKNWPRAVRANGHLQLNSEKMSKSTGNFMTLEEAMKEFTSDGMRFALADSGDGVDDANFLQATVNQFILRMTTLLDQLQESKEMVDGPVSSFAEKVFDASIDNAVAKTKHSYDRMLYHDVLVNGFFDLCNAKDEYLNIVKSKGESINKGLYTRFYETLALLMSPITPHTSEKLWQLLGKKGSIMHAAFPEAKKADLLVLRVGNYMKDTLHNLRLEHQKATAPKKGKAPPPKTRCDIYVCDEFPEWQKQTLDVLLKVYDEKTNTFTGDYVPILKENAALKPNMKQVMPFAAFVKQDTTKRGAEALEKELPFKEFDVLNEHQDMIRKALGGGLELGIHKLSAEPNAEAQKKALPGKPCTLFA